MTMPVRPPLGAISLPGQEALTSLEAYKAARVYVGEMGRANVACDAAITDVQTSDAMEAFDASANALLGLLAMLEQRGVLADVEQYLDATYGRV